VPSRRRCSITLAGYLFYSRVAGFDKPTAFFGAVPGGLTDMVTMSEDAGANQRVVTLLSAVRMVLIVFLVPLYMQFVSGMPVGGAVINTVHIWEMSVFDGAMLIGLGVAGWWIATTPCNLAKGPSAFARTGRGLKSFAQSFQKMHCRY